MKVREVLLTMCGLLALTYGALAQPKIEFGAKAGMNYSGLNLANGGKLASVNYNWVPGYHFGGYAVFRMPKFAIQPELLFSRQGQVFTTPNYANLHTPLNYISVPVVAKYYLGSVLHVEAGAQVSFLIASNGNLVQIYESYVGQSFSGQDIKPYLKSTDVAITFGAGVDLPYGTSITVRYIDGISDINKYTNTSSSLPGNLHPSINTAYTRNQVVQFSVGYKLGKKGK